MEILILSPFNGVFFGLFALFASFFAYLFLNVRKKGKKYGENALCVIMISSVFVFFVYKGLLPGDAEYQEIRRIYGMAPTSIWNELPFALCNINMFLIPIGILTKRKSVLSFAFFLAPLGAFLALIMPSVGFSDCSILLPRMLGFYITHFMIFFSGLSLYTFGIYSPEFKELPGTIFTAFIVSFIVFLINVFLRVTKINPISNYFFEFYGESNPIFEFLFATIKLPYISILPLLLVLLVYMYFATFVIKAGEKLFCVNAPAEKSE